MKRAVIVLAITAVLAMGGCALFIGPGCDFGWLAALSHPFTPCDASGN